MARFVSLQLALMVREMVFATIAIYLPEVFIVWVVILGWLFASLDSARIRRKFSAFLVDLRLTPANFLLALFWRQLRICWAILSHIGGVTGLAKPSRPVAWATTSRAQVRSVLVYALVRSFSLNHLRRTVEHYSTWNVFGATSYAN